MNLGNGLYFSNRQLRLDNERTAVARMEARNGTRTKVGENRNNRINTNRSENLEQD